MEKPPEHTLEFLLAFDGRIHWLEEGYWLKFEIRLIEPTTERPHGLRYALTLHDPDGKRLMGFDNAHTVAAVGSRFAARPEEADHWHRDENDVGRPYAFVSAEKLITDFFAEARRVLEERGISETVIRDEEERRSS